MAGPTIKGGLGQHHPNLGAVHDQLAGASSASNLDTVSGLSVGSGFAHDTVGGGPGDGGGWGGLGPVALAGQAAAPTENVVATQTIQPGGVTLHFADGTSINVVGASHIDHGFFG